MITNPDRSGWFGASDSRFMVAKNRTSKSWLEWWNEKLGYQAREIHSEAIAAGTAWEHKILDAVDPAIRKDHQVLIEKYRLRVNYDGDKDGTIYEVKTHNFLKEFKVTNPYWYQAQAEMYAWKLKYGQVPRLYIVAYGLIEQEYKDYSGRVDDSRIEMYQVEYDKAFIQDRYLPNLKELCRALRKGRFPG